MTSAEVEQPRLMAVPALDIGEALTQQEVPDRVARGVPPDTLCLALTHSVHLHRTTRAVRSERMRTAARLRCLTHPTCHVPAPMPEACQGADRLPWVVTLSTHGEALAAPWEQTPQSTPPPR